MNRGWCLWASRCPMCWLVALAALALAPFDLASSSSGSCSTVPGPNSRHSIEPLGLFSTVVGGMKGTGWGATAGPPEGEIRFEGIRCKSPNQYGIGHEAPQGASRHICSSKRSFRRMQCKLAQHGFASYRGRLWFDTPAAPSTKPSSREEQVHHPRQARPHASFMSWDCMSLRSHDYLELMHWIGLQQLDIVMVQSTNWTLTEPWQKFGYTAYPSAETDPQGSMWLLPC